MYDQARYSTMTGEHLEGTLLPIEPRQAELEALHKRLWPELYEPRRSPVKSIPAVTFARAEDNGATLTLTDGEIQVKALGARNGEKFARLWAFGDIQGYPSQSEADLALCGLLAFYTREPPAD
jgi:primase-polymerase (primpol)-like protein